MTSRAEKDHMGRVAALPCACCGADGVQVHHLREGQGMSQRASNYLTVPLCPDCHTGPKGLHGDRSLLRIRKLGEMDLLAKTISQLMERR